MRVAYNSSFNSLFEMLHYSARAYHVRKAGSLSILYLRCTVYAVRARVLYVVPTFNSLFEMLASGGLDMRHY